MVVAPVWPTRTGCSLYRVLSLEFQHEMSRKALQRRVELLRETTLTHMALARSELVRSGLPEAVAMGEALQTLERQLERKVQAHAAVLDRVAPKLPERVRPHYTGNVLHLPRAAVDHAPMPRRALQAAFPLHYPDTPVVGLTVARLNVEGRHVEFKMDGTGLCQHELDVLMAALQLADGRCDQTITVSVWKMLRMLGRSTNAGNARAVAEQMHRLRQQRFYAVDANNSALTGQWSILREVPEGAQESAHNLTYAVDGRVAAMFMTGFDAWCPVELAVRRALGNRATLARWLHAYLSTYPAHHRRSVDDLHALSGARREDMRRFRHELMQACRQLEAIGFLVAGRSRCVTNTQGIHELRTEKAPRRFRLQPPQEASVRPVPVTMEAFLEIVQAGSSGKV